MAVAELRDVLGAHPRAWGLNRTAAFILEERGRPVRLETLVRPHPRADGVVVDEIDPVAVNHRLRAGAVLRLGSLHRLHAGVARFALEAERTLGVDLTVAAAVGFSPATLTLEGPRTGRFVVTTTGTVSVGSCELGTGAGGWFPGARDLTIVGGDVPWSVVTVDVAAPSASELIGWVDESLAGQAAFADFRCGDDARSMREAVADAWREPDLVARYLAADDSRSRSRCVWFGLPSMARDDPLTGAASRRVHLLLPRRPRLSERPDGSATLEHGGASIPVCAAALPVIRSLVAGEVITVADVRAVGAEAVVTELADHGFVGLDSEPSDAVAVPTTLAEVLAPVDEATFRSDYLDQAPLYVAGTDDRFRSLLPWEVLDRMLVEHPDDWGNTEPGGLPRWTIDLARRGAILPPTTALHDGGLDAAALRDTLRRGATLLVSGIDVAHVPLGRLAADVERVVGERAQLYAFATFGTEFVFNVHADKADVLILQVEGRKHWDVYPPGDPTKVADPVWSGELCPGDVLYLPRGWLHVAVPRDEQSVHVRFSLPRRRTSDLLRWLDEELRRTGPFREDLRLSDQAQLDEMRAEVRGQLSPDLLDRFLWAHDGTKTAREAVPPLPLSATRAVLPANADPRLQWLGTREVPNRRSHDGRVEVHAQRQRFTVDAWLWDALAPVRDGGVMALDDLLAGVGDADRERARRTIVDLVLAGHLWIDP